MVKTVSTSFSLGSSSQKYAYPFSKFAVIQGHLTWPRKSLKFKLHHLEIENIFTGFKMTVLSPKSGIMKALIFVIFIQKQPVTHVLKLKDLLKMLKNSQTNTCAEVSF